MPAPNTPPSTRVLKARKLRRAIDGLASVLAIELIAGTRGCQLRAPLVGSPTTTAVVQALRAGGVHGAGPDRHLAPEIQAATVLVRNGSVLAAAQSCTGPLR